MENAAANLRFFLGLRETAGYFARLAEGLRELGYVATPVDLSGHPFRYESSGWWKPAAQTIARRRKASAAMPRLWWRGMQWILSLIVLAWALPKYDVFILSSLPRAAAWPTIGLLRLAGKKVIVLFTGSDSRPPYLDGYLMHGIDDGARLARATSLQARNVRAMVKWATAVVSHTASSHLIDRPFVPFLK